MTQKASTKTINWALQKLETLDSQKAAADKHKPHLAYIYSNTNK